MKIAKKAHLSLLIGFILFTPLFVSADAPCSPVTPPSVMDQITTISQIQENTYIAKQLISELKLLTNGVSFKLRSLQFCGFDEKTEDQDDYISLNFSNVQVRVVYGTDQNNLNNITAVYTLNEIKSYSILVENLAPSTVYYFQIQLRVNNSWVAPLGVLSTISGSNAGVPMNPAAQNPGGDPLDPAAQNPGFDKLKNPLGDTIGTLPEFIKKLVDILLIIGVPIVAMMIIWSGFLLVTARGNSDKIEAGKKAFMAAVIGGAILLGSYVIAEAISGTINQIRG